MQRLLRVIAGPTASGKSARALAEARASGGIIINADALQLYRDLPILTAQPDAEARAEVPHRLYGMLDASDIASAARWAALARAEVEAAWQDGRLPILVGGTGLYLRTLIDGIAPIPAVPPAIRTGVRALAPSEVRRALEAEDPVMAARLHPHDPQRNARALEVIRATGRSLADWQRLQRTGGIGAIATISALVLDPPRDVLHARIGARIQAMQAAGAEAEVRALADRQLPADLPILRAIGVPPLLAHLQGTLGKAEAVACWETDTRRYAKRQATWFRTQFRGWPRHPA
ncbi:tRNA (adenosine(37)-N6)-dimethylallyltransferase MiaA [Thermaurantiacus sp.]